MQKLYLNSINYIINLKLNDKDIENSYIQDKLNDINFKSIINNSLNKKFIDLFDPVILSILKNDAVYQKYMGSIISKENYLAQIKKIDKKNLIKTVEENIDYLEPNKIVHKYMLEEYIKYQQENGIFKENKKDYNASLNKIVKPSLELKTAVSSIIKLNAHKLNLFVEPKCFTIEEYFNYIVNTTGDHKYALQKQNEFKKIKGECKNNKKVLMNISHFNDLLFSFTNSNNVYFEILKTVNHELCHIMQSNEPIALNKYPNIDQYKYLKEIKLAELDPEFYTKYHDYFELEIQANLYGYKQVVKELRKNYKNNKELIAIYEEKIKQELMKRCTKSYDMINKQFDKIIAKNKDIKNNKYFYYEYKNGKKRTLFELVNLKEEYFNNLKKDEKLCEKAKSSYLDDIKKFKEDGEDKMFFNNILFDQMIRLTTTKLELNCMVMNNNQLLALKEALFAGRFNYMNNSDMLMEGDPKHVDKLSKMSSLEYTKEMLKKIEEISLIIEKNLVKQNKKRR